MAFEKTQQTEQEFYLLCIQGPNFWLRNLRFQLRWLALVPGIRLMPFHSWGEVIVSVLSVGIKWDGILVHFVSPTA